MTLKGGIIALNSYHVQLPGFKRLTIMCVQLACMLHTLFESLETPELKSKGKSDIHTMAHNIYKLGYVKRGSTAFKVPKDGCGVPSAARALLGPEGLLMR